LLLSGYLYHFLGAYVKLRLERVGRFSKEATTSTLYRKIHK
jgi:hypothetical protein